eukprot:m.146674 g.146674  ORF g.146674 m.146674 type:complete len:124 (+) comp15035_c3_seq1:536-907(+)
MLGRLVDNVPALNSALLPHLSVLRAVISSSSSSTSSFSSLLLSLSPCFMIAFLVSLSTVCSDDLPSCFSFVFVYSPAFLSPSFALWMFILHVKCERFECLCFVCCRLFAIGCCVVIEPSNTES